VRGIGRLAVLAASSLGIALAVPVVAVAITAWPAARDPARLPGLAAEAFFRGDRLSRAALALLAWSGSAAAERTIGVAILDGRGGANPEEALAHLRSAAGGGDVQAQVILGKALVTGRGGLVRDGREAARWLEPAANAGDPFAAYWLGVLLHSELGGRDDPQAVAWLERAAKANLPAALFLLGGLYRDGRGVPVNHARAVECLEAAAEAELPEAIEALALAYRGGELGLARDEPKAAELLRELEHAIRHPQPEP
jgi:TPR repeat protein